MRHRSSHDQRGATLLEFAFASIAFFALIFGLIDGALLVRARNTVRDTADAATRRAAVSVDSPLADYHVLDQINGTGLANLTAINRIIIYRVDPTTTGPTDTCRSGVSVNGECNVYTADALSFSESSFGCASSLDSSWCPTERAAGTSVGVWIDVEYQTLTGIFGDVQLEGDARLAFEDRGTVTSS